MFRNKILVFILLLSFSIVSAETSNLLYSQKNIENETEFSGYIKELRNDDNVYHTDFFLYLNQYPRNSILAKSIKTKNGKFSFDIPFLEINNKYKLFARIDKSIEVKQFKTRNDLPIVITESVRLSGSTAGMFASVWVGDGPDQVDYWFDSYAKDEDGNISQKQTTAKKTKTISKTSSHSISGVRTGIRDDLMYCFIPYAQIQGNSYIGEGNELCFPDVPWVKTLMPSAINDNTFALNGKITNFLKYTEVDTWFKYYKQGDESNYLKTPKKTITKPDNFFTDVVSIDVETIETWCYRACASGVGSDFSNCGEEWCFLVIGDEGVDDGEIITDKKARALSGDDCEQAEITLYLKCSGNDGCKDVRVIDVLRSDFEYILYSEKYYDETGGEGILNQFTWTSWSNKLEWDLGDINEGAHKIVFRVKFLDTIFPNQITNVVPDSQVIFQNGSVPFPKPNSIDPVRCDDDDEDDDDDPEESVLWTYFVYLAADNNLNSAGIIDIKEMMKVGSTDDVNIVVLYDGVQQGDSQYLYIEKGQKFILKNMGEVNTGDPQTLIDSAEYFYKKFPAEKYALVLWNHGSGIKTQSTYQTLDIGFDDGSGKDALNNEELDFALKQITNIIGQDIDLIAYDACLMHMIEIAYYTRDDVLISEGSQAVEPEDGFAYDLILDSLVNKPSMDADELSVITSNTNISQASHFTASSVDLSEMDYLAVIVHEFSIELIKEGGRDNSSIENARLKTEKYSYVEYLDLGHFAENIISENISGDLNSSANKVIDALEDSVIWHGNNSSPNEHGLSIFYSATKDVPQKYLDLEWSEDTCWDEFLRGEDCSDVDDEDDDEDDDESELTFVMYMSADNNLDPWGWRDIQELARTGSTKDVNFIVIWDGVQDSDSRYYYIEKDNIKEIHNPGELNMGDPEVFQDSVSWAFKKFPAKKNILTIWNHGGGVAKSRYGIQGRMIAWDDSQKDVLTDVEIDKSLEIIRKDSDIDKFDVIFEFACLMQMVEAVDYMQDDAKYVVASEDIGYAHMTDFKLMAQDYISNPGMDAEELAKTIIKYTKSTPTMAVVETKGMKELTKAIHEVSKELINEGGRTNSQIASIFLSETKMGKIVGGYPYYDLRNVLNKIALEFLPKKLGGLASDTIEILDDVIIEYKGTSEFNGVSIYYPEMPTLYDKKNYDKLPFAEKTCWDEFVRGEECRDSDDENDNYDENLSGDFLIILEDGLKNKLKNELAQYTDDLEKEGISVYAKEFKESTIEDLRRMIKKEHDKNNIKGVWLLGNLPAAWYEGKLFQQFGIEEFPIDVYLGDLDDSFVDTDNDGIFDQHTQGMTLEIFVSRLNGSLDKISNYFGKIHQYREQGSLVNKSAYVFVDNDWSAGKSDEGLNKVYNVDIQGDNNLTNKQTYVDGLSKGYEFVSHWVHSDSSAIYFDKLQKFGKQDINSNLKGSFFNLFSCSIFKFTDPNALGMYYLTDTETGLAAVGSSKIGSMLGGSRVIFHSNLANGMPWGEAFRNWFNINGNALLDWHMGMTLFGDPMLLINGDRDYELSILGASIISEKELIKILEWDARQKTQTFTEYKLNNLKFFNTDRQGVVCYRGVKIYAVKDNTGYGFWIRGIGSSDKTAIGYYRKYDDVKRYIDDIYSKYGPYNQCK